MSNIRKSFDDKSQNPSMKKSIRKEESETMKSIITNYLAFDCKTDAGNERKTINLNNTRNKGASKNNTANKSFEITNPNNPKKTQSNVASLNQ